MARLPRLVLPGLPYHVTQRGNRRQPTFFGEEDYALYLKLLRFWCAKAETAVWAWCLMPNHVHLVLVPARPEGLAAALAPAHRRYTWEINQRQGWRGFLWQSRFASCPMDEAHLHACLRYVELNPVRAGLVARPEQWRWSSARAHLGLAADGLTDLDPRRRADRPRVRRSRLPARVADATGRRPRPARPPERGRGKGTRTFSRKSTCPHAGLPLAFRSAPKRAHGDTIFKANGADGASPLHKPALLTHMPAAVIGRPPGAGGGSPSQTLSEGRES